MDIHPYRPRDDLGASLAEQAEVIEIAALTRRLVAGDEAAYRIFNAAYFDRLLRYLLVVTRGDEEAAREALQETFRRVVRHIRVFSNETIFWSWLTVLARSSRSDERRKRRRYLAFLDRFTRHAVIHQAAEKDDRSRSLDAILEQNLNRLPADERELLELKYFEHCPVQAISLRLKTTEKAVESRLMRIRQKLKHSVLKDLKNEAHD